MQYEELTQSEKQDLATYDMTLRVMLRKLLALLKDVDTGLLAEWSKENIDPLLLKLDNTAVIPNPTTYTDAKDMTSVEFAEMQTLARALVTMQVDNIRILTKAVGINAS